LVAAVYVLFALDRWRRMPRHPAVVSAVLSGLALAGAAFYLVRGPLRRVDGARLRGLDAYTDVLAAAHGRPGYLLVAPELWDMGRPQLRTRRGVLLDPTQLNMITKIPGSGPRMAEILRRAYGIDLREPPHDSGGLWGELDVDGWRRLRQELGVTDVLVYTGHGLPLPLVREGPRVTLYAIPD
jgi:hypothetical protein